MAAARHERHAQDGRVSRLGQHRFLAGELRSPVDLQRARRVVLVHERTLAREDEVGRERNEA